MQQKHASTETIELVPFDTDLGNPGTNRRSRVKAMRRALRRNRWFLLVVVAPTLAAAIYYGMIAADRYVAESKFVVRSPSTAASSQISSLVQGSGIIRSSDDAYIVHAYMSSRDAIRTLLADADLLARLSRPEADILWRYPLPLLAHNEERLWRHFKSLLSIDYDSTTGISTLAVQAFRPKDAEAMAQALLTSAETLINRLSERAQGDAIRLAEIEVERSRALARQALGQVTEFRRRNAVVDPGRMSNAALETITRLALEAAQTNAQLSELQKASPDSPQAQSLRNRVAAIDDQIRKERAALAGADTSLAPIIAEYERLVLEREFAERTFASAQSALDLARLESQRQRLFLERISVPAAPDYPRYPYRWLGVLGVFGLTLMLFVIGRKLATDTRAHAEQ